jgi:hypothetical protein
VWIWRHTGCWKYAPYFLECWWPLSRCHGWREIKLDVNARWARISLRLTSIFVCFSLFALLVVNLNDIWLHLILSYLSSNIDNEGKTFNSSCNTEHRKVILKVMSVNDFIIFYQVHILIVFFSFLQWYLSTTGKDVKAKEYRPRWKRRFLWKSIKLFASSRLCCGVFHPIVRLHWINNTLVKINTYFG